MLCSAPASGQSQDLDVDMGDLELCSQSTTSSQVDSDGGEEELIEANPEMLYSNP